MKKYLLVLAVLLLAFKFGKSQINVYHPMPDSSATWNVQFGGGQPPNLYNGNYALFIRNDTVIGNYSYHALYSTGQETLGEYEQPYANWYMSYKGAFRQDTLHKKVFFIPGDTSTQETLLYDFNLNVGDTLPPTYNASQFNLVSGIDSVLVGSIYHKRFYLTQLWGYSMHDPNVAIIEGVGRTTGFSEPLNPCFEACSQLTCFDHKGQSYPANSFCSYTIGINEINKPAVEIALFPNPVINNLQINYTKQNMAVPLEYSIIDYLGKVISTGTVSDNKSIDVSKLNNGLYLLRLHDKQNNVVQNKFLKQ